MDSDICAQVKPDGYVLLTRWTHKGLRASLPAQGRINTNKRENREMMKRVSILAGAFVLAALFTVQAAAKEITVRGHLGQTVEAGGWLIIAETDETTHKYLFA